MKAATSMIYSELEKTLGSLMPSSFSSLSGSAVGGSGGGGSHSLDNDNVPSLTPMGGSLLRSYQDKWFSIRKRSAHLGNNAKHAEAKFAAMADRWKAQHKEMNGLYAEIKKLPALRKQVKVMADSLAEADKKIVVLEKTLLILMERKDQRAIASAKAAQTRSLHTLAAECARRFDAQQKKFVAREKAQLRILHQYQHTMTAAKIKERQEALQLQFEQAMSDYRRGITNRPVGGAAVESAKRAASDGASLAQETVDVRPEDEQDLESFFDDVKGSKAEKDSATSAAAAAPRSGTKETNKENDDEEDKKKDKKQVDDDDELDFVAGEATGKEKNPLVQDMMEPLPDDSTDPPVDA